MESIILLGLLLASITIVTFLEDMSKKDFILLLTVMGSLILLYVFLR